MDQIKEAFLKVKEDINFIHQENVNLKQEINILKEQIILLNNSILNLNKEIYLKKEASFTSSDISFKPTNPLIIQDTSSTGNKGVPTNRQVFKPLNDQIYDTSTGNKGVPTNRQTDQQTDQQTDESSYNYKEGSYNIKENISERKTDSIENALNLLNSLDNIKKEIRLKFKKLTDQEVLVFSTLYQFDEEKGFSDYRTLSEKLNLSESSIRDYVGKLIQKGIPIDKVKLNNKNIQLKISPNLKKIASLPAILQLRDL